jgi:hypothetical protein
LRSTERVTQKQTKTPVAISADLMVILLKNPPFILREPQDERWGG